MVVHITPSKVYLVKAFQTYDHCLGILRLTRIQPSLGRLNELNVFHHALKRFVVAKFHVLLALVIKMRPSSGRTLPTHLWPFASLAVVSGGPCGGYCN